MGQHTRPTSTQRAILMPSVDGRSPHTKQITRNSEGRLGHGMHSDHGEARWFV